ncbi:MAG TPA: DNA mismatch repair protein MutS [Gemmatimonadales bacterium]|nr:DNA mismatch repair protein MutS [Gemmatimonadales bacterium]
MSVTLSEDTPLLTQYREIKSRHQDAILFFRMGDFYEMFFEDAELGARVLNITLTSRGDGVPLAGVPVKAAAEYLRQLVANGHRVAICEQVEDPRTAKGLVRREVVETVTPGSLLEDGWIAGGRNNWIVAVNGGGKADGRTRGRADDPTARPPDRLSVGLASIDLTTGEFLLETVPAGELEVVLGRLKPAEVVVPEGSDVATDPEVMRTAREPWEFDSGLAGEELARRFRLASLDGLGLGETDAAAVGAAGALLRYLTGLKPAGLSHIARPSVRRSAAHLWLDEMTRRNLELVEPLRAGAKGVTLLEVLDRTVTPLGARLLRQWLLSPLSDPVEIGRRLDAVDTAVRDPIRRAALREALDGVRDLERLAGRAAAGRAIPRELGALRDSFLRLPAVRAELEGLCGEADGRSGGRTDSPPVRPSALLELLGELDLLADLAALLAAALTERPPAALGDGGVIREGYDAALDESRSLREGGKQYIASLQQRERDRTGIPSLKVGYNKVFGYYLEITNAHSAKVPAGYERRQTLATAERYVTPELKEYEAKVLGAEERVAEREAELFGALRDAVGRAVTRIQQTARVLARLDVWAALAEVAVANRYGRPVVTASFDIVLIASRHPVIERMMPRETFIPNDVRFDPAERVQLVTGPNMAGKSTILRQIGLNVILAQTGSFVPCERAEIGVVDRLFTRVGASDNLAGGQSTFMVEMSETSAILHGATARSLVLLDEIGRGTSTYDGVAIAWAVTEFLHDTVGCKTMFATHYHELMQLPERLQHARNLNVAVREAGGQVVFLHRLEPGGTDRSYGIHVAELAGLPRQIVTRANAVLRTLEGEHRVVPGTPGPDPDPGQLPLFVEAPPDPALVELRSLDLNALTPLEALNRLAELQRRAGGPA